jgi:CRISPR-associated endoribonuclease Cas6
LDEKLAAFVLYLRAVEPVNIENHMGRAVQQLCLDLIRRTNPELSEQLHDANDSKPYAVSGLLQHDSTEPVYGRLPSGTRAWMRLAGLNSAVVNALTFALASCPPQVELDRAAWRVESVAAQRGEHPWVGQTTYADLLRHYTRADPPDSLTLHFAAPTGFHSKGTNMPLPVPDLVFGSLLSRWNAFGPAALPDLLTDFVEQQVVVHRYETATRMPRFKQGSIQVGFVGEVMYTLLKRNPSLSKHNPTLAERLAAEGESLARALHLLAAFGFYSGIGIKTTTGMGMVK